MSRAHSARVPPRMPPVKTLAAIAQIFTVHLPDQREEGRTPPYGARSPVLRPHDVLKAIRRESYEDFEITKEVSAGQTYVDQAEMQRKAFPGTGSACAPACAKRAKRNTTASGEGLSPQGSLSRLANQDRTLIRLCWFSRVCRQVQCLAYGFSRLRYFLRCTDTGSLNSTGSRRTREETRGMWPNPAAKRLMQS